MSKRYTYEEVMNMTDEEFDKLRSRHWLAQDISRRNIPREPENIFDNPYFQRDLIKKGITGVIILGAVCIASAAAVKVAKIFAKNKEESNDN